MTGPCGTRLSEPSSPAAATAGTKDDLVASFSSRGNAVRGADLVAPGRSNVGLRNPGSNVDLEHPLSVVADRFARGSGTSQAAAVTSGRWPCCSRNAPPSPPTRSRSCSATPPRTWPRPTRWAGRGAARRKKAAGAATPGAAASAQPFPPATGLGSLEGARGSAHLLDGDIAPEGEQDIFGNPWDGRMWSGRMWSGRMWSSEPYN